MNKAIYIATSEENSGKSIITLGLMSMLIGKTAKVGYFRPIVEDFEEGELDNHIETVINHFGLDISFEDSYAITKSQLIKKKNKGLDLFKKKFIPEVKNINSSSKSIFSVFLKIGTLKSSGRIY